MTPDLNAALAAQLENPARPAPDETGPSEVFQAARNHGPACFAPPLDDAKLNEYESLAASAGPAIRDAMGALLDLVKLFWATPESSLPGEPLETLYTRSPFRHPQTGQPVPPPEQVPLEAAEINRIWDAVPWWHELQAMADLFESIPNESAKPLRDAAFHLLWFARELSLDREPMTNDKL